MAEKKDGKLPEKAACEAFFDEPFAILRSQKFAREKSGKIFPLAPDNIPDETELFLREYKRLGRKRKPAAEKGFSMAEICQLPEIARAENIREKRKPETPQMSEIVPENEFLDAIGKTEPLRNSGRAIRPAVKPAPIQCRHDAQFGDLLGENLEFALLFSDEYFEGHVSGLDERIMTRLRNGQMSPEAHLDLHGLNSFQAYEALRDFFRTSWFKGLHVVLLVPGRGLNSPNGRGILRQKLQTWLTQEPFKRIVLGFCTARPHDGGPGSVYVLLRKFRKKGRIYWDRLPADPDLY